MLTESFLSIEPILKLDNEYDKVFKKYRVPLCHMVKYRFLRKKSEAFYSNVLQSCRVQREKVSALPEP